MDLLFDFADKIHSNRIKLDPKCSLAINEAQNEALTKVLFHIKI